MQNNSKLNSSRVSDKKEITSIGVEVIERLAVIHSTKAISCSDMVKRDCRIIDFLD